MNERNDIEQLGDDTAGEDLRSRIEAAKERTARLAGDSAEAVRGVIQDHPLAVVAGGIALGVLIGRLLPTRKEPRSLTGALGKRAAELATLGAELAIAYASKAAEAGREGAEKLEDAGATLGGKVVDGSAEVKKRAIDLAGIAGTAARGVADVAVRRATDLASRVRH